MSYQSKTWVAMQAQYPTRYKIRHSDLTEEQVTIANDFGTVVEGDVFDESTMNNLESRIASAFSDDADAIEDASGKNIAEEYDDTSTYAVEDYCVHEGILYKCTTSIQTAEAWTPAHWTRCLITDEMSTSAETIVTGTLVAGATSITLSDASIEATSWIMPWASVWGIMPLTVVLTTGSVTLTFEEQSTDMTVGVVVK